MLERLLLLRNALMLTCWCCGTTMSAPAQTSLSDLGFHSHIFQDSAKINILLTKNLEKLELQFSKATNVKTTICN